MDRLRRMFAQAPKGRARIRLAFAAFVVGLVLLVVSGATDSLGLGAAAILWILAAIIEWLRGGSEIRRHRRLADRD
jgi:hypothetical protein